MPGGRAASLDATPRGRRRGRADLTPLYAQVAPGFSAMKARGGGSGGRTDGQPAQGWEVNRKRVQRLWREEGLRVPQRKRKRRRLGESTVPAERLRAERPNQVGAGLPA